MSNITAQIEEIDPAQAEQILAGNRRNRNISQSRVTKLASDIRDGEWQINGEAIKIANDGTLLDGQHRLNAILEADKPITTMVVRGLPVETQDTMDTGSARSLADVLKLAGEETYVQLSAGLRGLYCYSVTGYPMPPRGARHSPTTKQALALLEYHPGMRRSAQFATSLTNMRYLNKSIISTCHYLFSQADGIGTDDVEQFFKTIASGTSLEVGHPIYAMRERLVKELVENGRVDPAMAAAFTVRAWNGVRRGEKLARLLYKHGDDCPKIYGLDDYKV